MARTVSKILQAHSHPVNNGIKKFKRSKQSSALKAYWAAKKKGIYVPKKHKQPQIGAKTEKQEDTKAQVKQQESTPKKSEGSPVQKAATFRMAERRIIDVRYFFSKFNELKKNGSLDCCPTSNICFTSEERIGLRSKFVLHCKSCSKSKFIWSEDPSDDIDDETILADTIEGYRKNCGLIAMY